MPKPRKKEEIVGQYFRWLLGLRGDVYFADGRTVNRPRSVDIPSARKIVHRLWSPSSGSTS